MDSSSSSSSDDEIQYSERYMDDENKYEYRHIVLPKSKSKSLPCPPRLLTEKEWRSLGVKQSLGWEHYSIFPPEPHVLLFRRLKTS